MSVMVQIRNMPDDVHRTLKSRAALAGMSLSDYLLAELHKVAEAPTMDEIRARIASLPSVTLSESHADAVRSGRDRE